MTEKEKERIIQDNQEKFDNYIEKDMFITPYKDSDRYRIVEFQNIHNGKLIKEKLPIHRATKICEPGLIGFDETLYPRFKKDYRIYFDAFE